MSPLLKSDVVLGPRPSNPARKRHRPIVLLAFGTVLAILVWISTSPRGIQVKVVNRTSGSMTRVQVALGSGRTMNLAPIRPGQSSSVRIRRAETSDIRLVYRQPDGVSNNVLRVGFRPEESFLS